MFARQVGEWMKENVDVSSKRNVFHVLLPKVLSNILLYIIADDFLCTIRWLIAWYFLLNSFSLCVDSMEADLFNAFWEPEIKFIE